MWDTLGDRSLQGLRVESGIIGAGKMAHRLRVLSALAENPSSVPCTHVRQPALEGSLPLTCVDNTELTHTHTQIPKHTLIKNDKSLKGESAVVYRISNFSIIGLLFVSK